VVVEPAWALTGRPGAPPLLPPAGIVDRIHALGAPLGVDPVPLLAERGLDAGFMRSGTVTCGGAGRLVPVADGWIVANLARPEDLDSVPAWLEVGEVAADPWPLLEAEVRGRAAADLVARAELLGLPIAALGEVEPPAAPVRPVAVAPMEPLGRPPVVVDLSSLWAGPLCTRLLADRGAHVIKVESVDRPDGARRGPRAFFERLHAGKEMRSLDLRGPELPALLATADVVVEASRPRALRQLGVRAEELRPPVWLAITGYGRHSNRVAFGDDAAVAGGLVAWDELGPCFMADAVADPLTGVAAAAAVVAALEAGGRWSIDASMAGVAAWVAGDDRRARWDAVGNSS
jgi:hypothetical protein